MNRWKLHVAAAAVLALAMAQPVGAQSDPTAQVAAAYGDLSIFILNVAAGNGDQSPKAEQQAVFKQAFADQFAELYAQLGPADQQSLASLPLLDEQIRQVWPSLPAEQRRGLRDQWAAAIQPMVETAPCELFDAMARAQLMPSFDQYKQTNVNHLLQCWHDHPELTLDAQERSASTGGVAGGTGDHATYMAMFNANMLSFTAGMNTASMGTATYTWK